MSIASRITAIEEHIENAYVGLANLGEDLTNVDKNINNIKSTLDNVYSRLPKISGKGTAINLTPTLKSRINSELYGDTSQNGTPTPSSPVPIESVTGLQNVEVCGKNIVDINGIYSASSTSNLRRSYENGVATIIWNSGFSLYMVQNDSENNLIKPFDSTKTYTISFKHKGDKLNLRFDETNTNIITTNTDSDYVTYSYTFIGLSQLLIKFVRSDNTGTAYLKEFQIEVASSSSTYEAYNGNTYNVNLGKNLLDITTLTDGYVASNGTLTNDRPLGEMHSNFIRVLPNATYTFKIFETSSSYDNWFSVGEYTNTSTNNFIRRNTMTTASQNYITFTTSSTAQYIIVSARNLYEATKVQLELGEATSYSEYFTPIELNKIGTYEDKIYKDSGKWYIEKNIGKVVLDGSESWQKSSNTSVDRFYLDNASFNMINRSLGYSNYFINSNAVVSDIGKYYTNVNQIVINFSTYDTTTLAQFKTWLSTHNTEVYYVLATPTYTQITNTELIEDLENLASAIGYDNQTNISSNGSLPVVISASMIKGAV